MTQRDLDRLRRGEITELSPPVVVLPPEPNWEAIEDAILQADPDFSSVESQVKGLVSCLSDFRRKFEETAINALNAITSEMRAIRRQSERQTQEARRLLDDAQKAYGRLENQFVAQVKKTVEATQRAQEVRKAQRPPPAPRPVKAKDVPPAPCWARSAEPAGKLNCGCQGAPVAYACEHPQVGGFVTLHAAALRDTILRKPDGTTQDLGTKHLVPCSLCQYRGTVKDSPALVSGMIWSTRTTVCEACHLRTTCPVPADEQLAWLPATACPDGIWAAEAI